MYQFAKLIVLAAAVSATAPVFSYAQMPVSPETRATVAGIVGDVMVNGQAYEYDRQLADTIGPRLTGSANYVHAVSWAEQQFKSLGLANVHTEGWKIPATWEPEVAASGRIVAPREQTLHIYSLGWSPSTPSGGVKGDVVYLEHLTVMASQHRKTSLLARSYWLTSRAWVMRRPSARSCRRWISWRW